MTTVNIRTNVFETNSSSSHSISISNDSEGVLETLPCYDGVVGVYAKDFGRQYVAYNDAETKLAYCMIDTQEGTPEREMLKKVVCEHVGATDIELMVGYDSYGSVEGSIDGGSEKTSRVAFVSEEALKNFIFNPKSYLFTGGDEYEPPPNFYDAGKNIEYKYVLVVEETNLVYKFPGFPKVDEIISALDSIFEYHSLCNKERHEDNFEFYTFKVRGKNDNWFSSIDTINQGFVTLYKLGFSNSEYFITDSKRIKIHILKLGD